jgi:DNA ligase-1
MMNVFDKTIYKKDSSGKIRFVTVKTYGSSVQQLSGVLGSEKIVEHKSIAKAKNIGKANETTPEEQAVKEAQAKITDKLSREYFNTIEEAEAKGGSEVMLPMLAKDYKKESKKVVYPCYVQPKLDGMRALYNTGIFSSRKGKVVDTMTHITNDIGDSTAHILDGELYAHQKSFQENMRLIKSYKEGESEDVMYHVYDLIIDRPFEDRIRLLRQIVSDNYPTVKVVETYVAANEEQMLELHSKFIEEGYEGTIIRHSNAGYAVNKRDTQLLKYKDFIDEIYTVVDILPSDKNPNQGVVHCEGKHPETGERFTFGCGMKFSHAEREAMLNQVKDYIGLKAEIRFFEYTEDYVPRFPVCHGFRLDK